MQALAQVYSNAKLKQELDAWVLEGEEADKAEPEKTRSLDEHLSPDPRVRTAEKRSKQLVERRASRPPPAPKAPSARGRKGGGTRGSTKNPQVNAPPTLAEPVKSSYYAHGMAITKTFETVCGRPDLSSKAKLLALSLAAHYPTIRPSRERLMALSSISRAGVARGLTELRRKGLLEWKSGKAGVANKYFCRWLP